jgi:hypothetical protein
MRPALLPTLYTLVAAACGSGAMSRDASTATARAWVRALGANEPDDAYALLSDEVRRRTRFEDFARRWRETPVERARQAQALSTALGAGATLGERARVELSASSAMTLVREDGGWKLDAPLLPAARAHTPEEALKLLAEALDERSVNSVLRLLTVERQEAVRQLLDDFAAGLRAHLGDSIEVTNDRATLVWSDGTRRWRVVLKREQGTWRVDDFSQQ